VPTLTRSIAYIKRLWAETPEGVIA
jgi:hypothetical protein